jgi:glucokinase
MDVYLGIDIGGTTIKCGLFKASGPLIKKWEIPTRKEFDGMFIVNDIETTIGETVDLSKLKGIGFGVPGPVDSEIVIEAVNLGWKTPVDLVKIFKAKFPHIEVSVANDANLAALGELFARPDSYESMVFMTIGTGVGGGVILNQKILEGAHGTAGEIGHMMIEADGRHCNCGNQGCLETYASATGIVETAKELFEEPTMLNYEELTAKAIYEAAKKNDLLALDVTNLTALYLARACANISSVINPDAFIIGGGVSKAGMFLVDKIKEFYQEIAFSNSKKAHFELSVLGNNAGIYGAYQAVKQKVIK